MSDAHRPTAREIAHEHLEAGDPLGWFEDVYSRAGGDDSLIPWADQAPNPKLVAWLEQAAAPASGSALNVGGGLGDDAEELARRGFVTTAFDISESAVAWSRARFPGSTVEYTAADLFHAPAEWRGRFDFVLESYTLQALPPGLRSDAIRCIASFVAPGGTLLVIARGREEEEPEGQMPWPLTRRELSLFDTHGLHQLTFDDYMDDEDPPVHRFRVTYGRA